MRVTVLWRQELTLLSINRVKKLVKCYIENINIVFGA